MDNIAFRIGWFSSRVQSRQQIVHGNIFVNGKRTKSPSYQIKQKDIIEVRTKNICEIKKSDIPRWIDLKTDRQATINELPSKDEFMMPFDEQLIIEYYSR